MGGGRMDSGGSNCRQNLSEFDCSTKSVATMQHSVDVLGQRYDLHVYQYADNLWIADGGFLGHQLRTMERTMQKAIRAWRKAAIEKRLFGEGSARVVPTQAR